MLHPQRVFRALLGNGRRQVRRATGLKPRPKAPVVSADISSALERHRWLCERLRRLLPPDLALAGARVCEAGAGDCLAAAAMLVGLGAAHATLVEIEPAVINEKQLQILAALRKEGFPVEPDIIRATPRGYELDGARVEYQVGFMDDFVSKERCDLVYSYCVLEHVENFDTFFGACFRTTAPGGRNLHVFDLGGHGMLEDPIPPLDFQTYPDWLYNLMYPPFHRATRRFLSDYLAAFERNGFVVETVTPLRTVDQDYYESIRPKLRPAARRVPEAELAVIEVAVLVRRPV